MISHNTAMSTEKQYQWMWSNFVKFLKMKNNILNESNIINFFGDLIDKCVSYSSLLAYRTALNRPIKSLINVEIVNSENLKQLFKYAKSHLKKQSVSVPCWKIDKVLSVLMSKKFKERCKFNSKLRNDADMFLVLLACPKRISEFSDFRLSSLKFYKNGSMSIHPSSTFFAKNHSATFQPENYNIEPNVKFPDICPVMAMKRYVNYTNKWCHNKKIVRPDFLWLNDRGTRASHQYLRSSVRNIIKESDSNISNKQSKFHSIRSVVASNMFAKYSLSMVMKRMQWASSSTFYKYYAKLGAVTNCPSVLAGCAPCVD